MHLQTFKRGVIYNDQIPTIYSINSMGYVALNNPRPLRDE
jgi:hypothetical protein